MSAVIIAYLAAAAAQDDYSEPLVYGPFQDRLSAVDWAQKEFGASSHPWLMADLIAPVGD